MKGPRTSATGGNVDVSQPPFRSPIADSHLLYPARAIQFRLDAFDELSVSESTPSASENVTDSAAARLVPVDSQNLGGAPKEANS